MEQPRRRTTFFPLVVVFVFSAATGSLPDDASALLRLRSRLGDPKASLSSWTGPDPCANWTGVSCLNRTARVVRLDLASLSLSGPVPSAVCRLSALQTLDLAGNSFFGRIPICLGRLRFLLSLDLSRNDLRGPVPRGLVALSRLEELVLSGNPRLGGPLPDWLGFFSGSLGKLDLSSCSFKGRIPATLYRLRSLRHLDLSGNFLVGEIGDFDAPLLTLKIATNNLSGTLPCLSASARSLSILDLSSNFIVGGIPTCISSLRKLSILNLSSNGLQYGISPRLVFSPELLVLDLSSNSLSGPIPSKIAEEALDRSGILLLYLSKNMFSGRIPAGIAELKGLQGLILSYNQLSGEILPSIGNLTYLQVLDLSHNLLSGPIPVSLAGCFQLWQLKLDHNNLSGILQPELDALDSLKILDLAANSISGEIPLPLAGCRSLEVVDLGHNSLGGKLNGAILKWQKLRFLSLAGNRFSGNLPDWIFSFRDLQAIDLSENQFTGFIPDGDFNVSADFNSNASIPGNFMNNAGSSTCLITVSIDLNGSRQAEFNYDLQSAVGIDLSDNSLRGEIPKGLIGLPGLQVLDLSHNHLAGPIPAAAGRLEKMHNLRKLDLSVNLLSGVVPTRSISALSDLKVLNLSYNCLSRPLVGTNERRRFPGAFAGNPNVCNDGGCRCPRDSAESGFPVAASSGNPGEEEDLLHGSGWEEEGLVSAVAFWISAAISFYFSMLILCCSAPMRAYMFQALKKPEEQPFGSHSGMYHNSQLKSQPRPYSGRIKRVYSCVSNGSSRTGPITMYCFLGSGIVFLLQAAFYFLTR